MATLENVVREIEALHEFFVAWFTGASANTDAAFDLGIARRLGPDFFLVPPGGQRLEGSALGDGLRGLHGFNPAFRVAIRNVRIHQASDQLIVATYEEWQRGAKNSTSPENGRISSVVFGLDEAAPNGLLWLHVHETWLPDDVVEKERFDF